MYENAQVKTPYGNGIVVSDVKCQGKNGDTYLLQILIENKVETISMYDDEVQIIHDA